MVSVRELHYTESHGGAAVVAVHNFANGYGVSVLRLTDEYRRREGYAKAERYEVAVTRNGEQMSSLDREGLGYDNLQMDLSAEDADKLLAKVESL